MVTAPWIPALRKQKEEFEDSLVYIVQEGYIVRRCLKKGVRGVSLRGPREGLGRKGPATQPGRPEFSLQGPWELSPKTCPWPAYHTQSNNDLL